MVTHSTPIALAHRPTHTHKRETHVLLKSGVLFEVCECGATRTTGPGEDEPGKWHVCEVCTHPWGRR